MTGPAEVRVGRGRAPRDRYHAGLHRDAVVTAAVDMLRDGGLAGFSLRRLAGELGVDTMALYKHVRNRDDLLGAALARVFAAARPAGDGTWWEQVAGSFAEHRRVLRAEPWALAVVVQHGTSSAEPWAGVDEALALMEPRLGADGAARWARWLAAYTNGFVLAEAESAPAPGSPLAAQRPRVAAAATRNAGAGDPDFAAGLDLLVAAMRAEASAQR